VKQNRYILLNLCIFLFFVIIHYLSAWVSAAPICPPNHDGMPSSSGCPNCGTKPSGIDVPINTDTNSPPDDQIPEPPRIPDRASQLARADCSRWPGTEPRWNERTNRVDCFCIQGMAWNRDHTACVDERQAAVEKADCSQWPGTEPRWNDRTNRVDCFCVQGMAWNRDHTACIDERQAALENTDCSRWPGSIPRWNNQTNRVECICPGGMARSRDNTRCISCADYENRFVAAYNANQLNAAQGFLQEAVNCPWYGKAADALKKRGQYLAEQNEKERKCNDLYNRFLNALNGRQFDQARGILAQAKDCGFQQQGYNDLCNQIRAALTEAKGRKDIRQFRLFLPQAKGCTFYEQANADLRQMELDEHCNKIGTALNEAKRLKDINRFRSLLTQAQKCGFYQQALADLRKMEGDQVQAKTKPAPPQPPSGHPSDPQYRQKCVGPQYYSWSEQEKKWILSSGLSYGSTNERVLSWSNPPCPQKSRRKTGPKSYVECRRYWDNCAQKYYCAEVEETYK
jgi:hypothetical protein